MKGIGDVSSDLWTSTVQLTESVGLSENDQAIWTNKIIALVNLNDSNLYILL